MATQRRRTGLIVAAVAAMGLAVLIGLALSAYILFIRDSGEVGTATTAATTGNTAVLLPQNPSLRLTPAAGNWVVENDGNVTMSAVQVTATDGSVLCDLGTMSPADRLPCDKGGNTQVRAVGNGPQGQPVNVGPSS